jgi:hypothetical protein
VIDPITEQDVLRVMQLLPSSNFLRQYVNYGMTQVASHASYHIAVGLALLGISTPRNFQMLGMKRTTFPNTFSLIVGSAGEAEKTGAIDVGRPLLAEIAPELFGPDPTAAETLAKILSTRPSQLFVYVDFFSFLSRTGGGDTRGEALRGGFTEWFDGYSKDFEYASGKKFPVTDPRPSLLAACTPSHLESFTQLNDWTGGFISRFLIFYADVERTMDWPDNSTHAQDVRAWLAAFLAWSVATTQAGKSLGLTDEAKRYWLSWVATMREKYGAAESEKNAAIISRTRLMAAKSALLLAWGSGKCLDPWYLDAADLNAGAAIAELSLRSALRLADSIASSREMQEQNRVYRAIGDEWTPLGDILRKAELTKKRAAPYLETLCEQGVITMDNVNGTVYYRRCTTGTIPHPGMPAPPPLPGMPL